MVIGVVLVVIVSRGFWPYIARSQFRKKASKSLHMTALLYSKIVSTFMRGHVGELSLQEFEELESKIQLKMVQMNELLTFAKSEPRLKVNFQRNFCFCVFFFN